MPDSPAAKIGQYRLTAIADVPDFRDWIYQPALVQLAKAIERPARLHIMDQGSESSCTGFALAAVVNLQRAESRQRAAVSPRMLYEMARRHDEWRGFRYEGSSCRGAIKGWYNMGVCLDRTWPYKDGKPGNLTVKAAKEARGITLGAYYRLGTRISDFHAALNETGVIFCSADVHTGWDKVSKKTGVIPLHDEAEGRHAFAIVGYNSKGFWIQNSWGKNWGQNGTALWLYEDWQQHLVDGWVLRLALPTPQVWHLPHEGGSDAGRTEGLFNKTPTRAEIAGHFVHIDDGRFHDAGPYWSNLEDVQQTAKLVASSDKYDHLLLYAHGGLNNARDSARRIAAMKETFKANRIYPYHFMYDTGLLEEMKDVLRGHYAEAEKRAGGLSDWTDRLIERSAHKAGRALWREMKSGAERPFIGDAAGTAVLEAFLLAISQHAKMKLHVVGHSTGAILHAYLTQALVRRSDTQRIASASLLAPAASIELFRSHFRPLLAAKRTESGIDRMDIYNLSDRLELDDNVITVYRKSLLYLVSRSFEEDPRPAGILGMQVHSKRLSARLPVLKLYYSEGKAAPSAGVTQSESHGGFDNDAATMNSVLRRVLGKTPAEPFTAKSLRY